MARERFTSRFSFWARTVLIGFPVITAGVALGGCAADPVYSSVRNAQRLQCHRMADELLRQRCLQDAGVSRSSYQEQVKNVQRPFSDSGAAVPEPTTTGSADTNTGDGIGHPR